jgi:hypothetical protein
MGSRAAPAEDLLDRAGHEAKGSTRRKLLTAAAFTAAALDDAVLVGGTAVELHTGSYRPTDIDLVGYRRRGYSARLQGLGFEKSGRHWLLEFADGETLAIEVPDDRLGDFAVEPPMIVDLEPGTLAVISLNDLMMDRLLQATGGEPVTLEEATRLAVAAYQEIGWAALEERATNAAAARSSAGEALPNVLATVRRRARRLLRRDQG